MPYAVKQDMIDRFGERELIQLTDRGDYPAGAIDDTVLTRALSDADERIDSEISGRYTLPLSAASQRLVRVAAVLARYYLYDDGAPEGVKDAHDQEIAFLKRVSDGKADLDVAPAPNSTGGAQTSAPERIFTQDSLAGY